MIVYKIRKKGTETYSNGGSYPSFTKTGKIWKTKGALTSHLNIVYGRRQPTYGPHPYRDAEIVVLEIAETPVDIINMDLYRQEVADRAKQREDAAKARVAALKEEAERRELARLQAKYGKKEQ